MIRPVLTLVLSCIALTARADPPVVEHAVISPGASGHSLSVTLSHPDTGWDHYANGWRVETADGTVLGLRDLAHPHVAEQPFTRSLTGVILPDGIDKVFIRARCNIDGWATETLALPLR